jgi:hypothetical protein
MTDDNWTLDQDSELNVLIPWLAAHPETEIPLRRFLAEILQGPLRRGQVQEYAKPESGDPPMLRITPLLSSTSAAGDLQGGRERRCHEPWAHPGTGVPYPSPVILEREQQAGSFSRP